MMGKHSKITTKDPQATPDENTVRILPPRWKRPAALFWDVYRNSAPAEREDDVRPH